MSSLSHIDAAIPRSVLPVAATTRPSVDSQGSDFAVVMRAAFSPARRPTPAPHLSAMNSTSSRRQPDTSQSNSGTTTVGPVGDATSDAISNAAEDTQVLSHQASEIRADLDDETFPSSSPTPAPASIPTGTGSTLKQTGIMPSTRVKTNPHPSETTPTKPNGLDMAVLANSTAAAAPIVAQSSDLGMKALQSLAGKDTNASVTIVSKTTDTDTLTKNSHASPVSPYPTHANKADATTATLHQPVPESQTTDRILADGAGAADQTPANGPQSVSAQEAHAAHAAQGGAATPRAAWNSAGGAATDSALNATQAIESAGNTDGNSTAGQTQESLATGLPGGSTDSGVKAKIVDDSGAGSPESAGNTGNNGDNGNAPSNSKVSAGAIAGSTVAPALLTSATAKGNAGALAPSISSGCGTEHEPAAGLSLGLSTTPGLFPGASHVSSTQNPAISNPGPATSHVTPSDAFAALDNATAGERGVLLHAAPHQVAVGITDPSLGWVEVRAERIAGQISATLSAISATSHAALTSVLPTMATYLQDHHTGVHQVHVETGMGSGQQGAGSQGQPFSQNDAPGSSESAAIGDPGSNGWAVAPSGGGLITASTQANGAFVEGHHFSIHA